MWRALQMIVDETLASLERVRADGAGSGSGSGGADVLGADDAHRPVYGPQVVIQTGEEKQYGKQARKQMRKAMEQQQRAARQGAGAGGDEAAQSDLLMALGLQRWREARASQLANPQAPPRPLFKKSARDAPVYPNVYDTQAQARSAAAHLMGHTMMLPPNARRTMGDRNLYEEIEIPPMRAAAPRETERRVPVTEFSQVAQMAFRGFTHLNRIQSIMFATVCMGRGTWPGPARGDGQRRDRSDLIWPDPACRRTRRTRTSLRARRPGRARQTWRS
jgi:hypothetical protein